MEFSIHKTDAGLFEIIQSKPVVVGSFADEHMARKVMAYLIEDALAPPASLPQINPAPEPEKVKTSPPQPRVWSDAEVELLIAMKRSGKIMSEIATALDRPRKQVSNKLYKLRGRIADLDNKPEGTDLVPTETIRAQHLQPASDQAHCSLCDRPFTPTPDNLDICARCRNA